MNFMTSTIDRKVSEHALLVLVLLVFTLAPARALALNADVNQDVFLGAQANEKNVKSIDLSNRKVIAFATHGLCRAISTDSNNPRSRYQRRKSRVQTAMGCLPWTKFWDSSSTPTG